MGLGAAVAVRVAAKRAAQRAAKRRGGGTCFVVFVEPAEKLQLRQREFHRILWRCVAPLVL